MSSIRYWLDLLDRGTTAAARWDAQTLELVNDELNQFPAELLRGASPGELRELRDALAWFRETCRMFGRALQDGLNVPTEKPHTALGRYQQTERAMRPMPTRGYA